MRLYRYSVGNQVGTDGVWVHATAGPVEDVNGVLYVSAFDGALMERVDDRWRPKADALRVAADEVSRMGRILLAQAERLREEADAVQA